MTRARPSVLQSVRLLALLAGLLCNQAHADEYTDVSQLVRAGKFADALKKADAHLASKPRDPQMRFLKGIIQRETGKPNDAIATFTRLTQDYPELPEPYNNLAVLYAAQNQYDKARAALEMAIRTNPSYATAHENLGDVYAKLASQAYSKALQLDNTQPAVPPKLALIQELFDPEAKGQHPSTAVAAAPSTPPAKPAATNASSAPPASAAPAVTVASTPATTPTSAPAANDDNERDKEVETAVRAWAAAWAAKDVKKYLSAYAAEFTPPGKASRSAWEKERQQRILDKNSISVHLSNVSVSSQGNKATVKFRQDYKADRLSISSRKTLEMVKQGNRWRIVKESTAG